MNGNHQNGKNHNFEKTVPGCLGRMVNLFESNVGVSANRLLTDKPYGDGLPLSRSRPDVTKLSPRDDQTEDKVIVSEFGNTLSSRKSNGMPMKRLIAQEMSKEVGSRHRPPNLVAKLMGLDALPQQESDFVMQRSHSRGHPQSQSEILMSCWEQQNGCLNNVDPNECKDVYEKWQQSQNSSLDGTYNRTTNNKKMALVRQKFIEAKRLSMDEKLRQSKQFQEALDVLNLNKDLFLKCLQESNTMFSPQLFNLHSIFSPKETKRITVLRPGKMVDSNKYAGCVITDGKQMNRGSFVQLNGQEKSHLGSSPPACWKNYENPTQLTRIVVLKPSPGKLHVEGVGFPQLDSPRMLRDENFFGDVEDDANQESREVAKAITHQIREKLGRHCRDETLVSSAFSNGYVGDESSFNKSEVEYAECNLSDSEVLSPISRHSWDYVNRLNSPYSSSSFSRASYSPESSSVCREARKRLSERWSMMSSNGICQEQRQVRKSSSTLGEMLALSEAKKEATHVVEGNSNIEPKVSKILPASGQKTDENVDHSPGNLVRSKSVPESSSDLGVRLNVGLSVPDKGKQGPKEDTKERSAKSSFKGKVSSLFFSSNKKPSKDNPISSQTKDEFHSSRNIPEQINNDRTDVLSDKRLELSSPCVQEPSSKSSFSNLLGKQGISSEIGLSGAKAFAFGYPVENQDHPSPISVLDHPPFEEDENTAAVFPRHVKPDRQGFELLDNRNGSNLIDKSPPIGSIARTLSWDDSCVVTASSYLQKESSTIQGTYDEELEWFFFVKTLLSVAGFQGEVQSNLFLTRWHSSESPLDPSLRDKYIELKDKDTLQEAKRRQKRSTRKLVFDCVNTVLVDISGYGSGSDLGQRAIPCTVAGNSLLHNTSITMIEEVWARIIVYFYSEIKCISDDFGDDNSIEVDRVVRKEVVGKGWVDHLGLEMDNLGKEIESKLLEELMQEAVVELTGRVF